MTPTREVDYYKDAANEWRWRVLAANGSDVLADSGEGYENLLDCTDIGDSLFSYPSFVVNEDGSRTERRD